MIENLMKRVYLFLEDGDFEKAGEYVEKVLDQDAEYAPAYAAKVCVKLKLHRESDLAEASPEYENDPDWGKAMRFAKAEQKHIYEGYIESARQNEVYQQARHQWKCGNKSVNKLNELAAIFDSIGDYKDAKVLAVKLKEEADALRTTLYNKAITYMNEANEESRRWSAIKQLLADSGLDGYCDVEKLRAKSVERYNECKAAEDEANRLTIEKRRQDAARTLIKKKRMTVMKIGAIIALTVLVLLWTQVIMPKNNYRNAITLQQEGKFDEAIAAFIALGNYNDAAVQITETKYLQAKALLATGNYKEAFAAFEDLKGYKDVDNLLSTDLNLITVATRLARQESFKKVGSYVTFGTYPQTSAGTDQTPIEWQILEYDDTRNRSLLISRYGLDTLPYNKEFADVTWENCTLRTWLNGVFYFKAFTEEEQSAILTTRVDNSERQGYYLYDKEGGNNTQDKVFLLSYAEAQTYFGAQHKGIEGAQSNTKARLSPTDYAIKKGAWADTRYKTDEGKAAGVWWLRSPGSYQYFAALIESDGSFRSNGVGIWSVVIRPAMWIDLNADIFGS